MSKPTCSCWVLIDDTYYLSESVREIQGAIEVLKKYGFQTNDESEPYYISRYIPCSVPTWNFRSERDEYKYCPKCGKPAEEADDD